MSKLQSTSRRITTKAARFGALAGALSVIAFSALGATGAGAVSPTAPAAPTGATATLGNGNVTLSWTVGADNGTAITNFIIGGYVSGVLTAAVSVPAGAVGSGLDPTPGAHDSYSVASTKAVTAYSFTVAAVNAAGAGAPSAMSNAVTSTAPPATGTTLTASVSTLNFGPTTLGDVSDELTVTFTNTGSVPAVITAMDVEGAGQNDFVETENTECDDPTTVAPGASCVESLGFLPGALGLRTATISPVDGNTTNQAVTLTGTGTEGYYEVTASGHVDTFGDAVFQGDLTGQSLPAPIVNLVSTADNGGYWLFDSLGNVYPFGDAQSFGDTGNVHLNKPIVGMASTGDDNGYWLVASDGGIFTFGDATFHGSTGNLRLNKPIVGMAATPDSDGYWLVATDGGIFTFGDAPFFGSTGALHLNRPIVGMSPTADYEGYWLVASDGGIFSFGDAPFYGSTGALKLNRPIVGMATTATGNGYWLDASDGGIFAFGDAPFYGSDGAKGITNSVGIGLDGYYTFQAFTDTPAARMQAHIKH
ncbi:MAG TPA: hypothetical protein VHV57_09730 [Acidimicrobiales bacterium]|nr:hypothetical protein [Acidimicrobiales bacterium]